MLFMVILRWEMEKRDEVIKRSLEIGGKSIEGFRLIGEWTAITGGIAFALVEVEDPKAGVAAALAWNDIADLEIIPVMESEEMRKLLPSR